ncbi:ZIP family metal transporter [Chryseobacterium sp. SC28]|uniref:ZIP family metal transporter n=1 Tax=Chryseobacterium sp. SC28 TaxID=2268028 RepID=UPI000F64D92D|nr:ZIP family metal transporter [Chryseobacterium sp. SC28]RRQ45342.1 zinc permease [Chryseobacterium sp. SC28]
MIITLLILSVLIGVFLGKYFGSKQQFAKNLLILSAGFFITICLNEVFPEVYETGGSWIGIFVILGVLIQMFLENLTKGFEHGHLHQHSDDHSILPVALIAGLFIHAFIEGIPLSHEKDSLSPYLLGILFHNIPISFVLGSFLSHSKSFSTKFWIIVLVFALASPLGMLLGKYFNENLKVYFLAVVGGIFLHISSVIIFESNKNHKMDWQKIVLVIVGIALALIGHLFHHH